jgi:parallel beta-helix repeat protein
MINAWEAAGSPGRFDYGGFTYIVADGADTPYFARVSQPTSAQITPLASGEILVAASDAPEIVQAATDYVCDGADDEVEINLALLAGKVVRLSEGNFSVGDNINMTLAGQALIGAGMGATVITADSGHADEAINLSAGDYMRISDLSLVLTDQGAFDGIDVATGSDYPIIERVLVDGAGALGIDLNASDHATVRDCIVTNSTLSGISAGAGDNALIEGNRVLDNVRNGIVLSAAVAPVVRGNIVTGNDSADAATYDGIVTVGATTTAIIADNIVNGNDGYQISIAASAVSCLVTGNVVSGTGAAGTITDAGTTTIIQDNPGVYNNVPAQGTILDLTDGVTAPAAVSGHTFVYTDTADGDLKSRQGDNNTDVLAADT